MHTGRLSLVFLYLLPFNSITTVAFTLNSQPFKLSKIKIKMSANGSNNEKYLTPITPDQVKLEIKDPVDPTALSQAKAIISELKLSSGTIDPKKLMEVGKRLGDIPEDGTTYVATKEECKAAFNGLSDAERNSLVNIHARVSAFANAQRQSVQDMEIDIPGGKAGHTVSPCSGKSNGCYKLTMRLSVTGISSLYLPGYPCRRLNYHIDSICVNLACRKKFNTLTKHSHTSKNSCRMLCSWRKIPSPLLRHHDSRHRQSSRMQNRLPIIPPPSTHHSRRSTHCRSRSLFESRGSAGHCHHGLWN
jgi:hypothetical protein